MPYLQVLEIHRFYFIFYEVAENAKPLLFFKIFLELHMIKIFDALCDHWLCSYFQDEDARDVEQMEEDVDGDLADIEALNYDDLDSVSKLQKTQRYNEIMQVISFHVSSYFTDHLYINCISLW